MKGPENGSVSGRPNETVFIQAEFRNNTYYPFKPGCQLVSLEQDGEQVIESVKMQVEQVDGMTNFKLDIPVQIKDSAKQGEHDIMFSM